MGKLKFWFKASCYIISVLFLCCFAAQFAYCQLITDHSTPPELLNSLLLTFPFKQTLTCELKNNSFFAGQKITLNNTAFPETAQTATKTNNVAESKSNAADSFDIKETITKTTQPAIDLSAAIFDDETETLISKYTEMISIDPSDVNNYSLYKFIDKWYGTKYKYGGMDNAGIDCSAFSQKVYGAIYGINILRTARQQRRSCELIKSYEDAVEGDLVFFRIRHLRISHVGVYLANGYFVHASRSRGVTISSLDDKYWNRRFAGCGKIAREDKTSAESDFLP